MTTHNVIRLPLDTTVFDRLNAHQRNANIAAERADWVRIARQVLRSPKYYTDQELRDACATLQAWGDATDYLQADAMIFALNKRERDRAHGAAKAAAETPADVARRFAHRWPEIVAGGAALAVLMLAGTGWL